MYKIRMLKDTMGSLNGFTAIRFKKDQEYEITESLYHNFIDLEACELVTEDKNTKAIQIEEDKAITPVIENKATKKLKKSKGKK